jgi:CheY-like chemotaxis protein
VLLVDDDPVVLEVTGRALVQAGYRVMVADDGAQAMGLYAMHRGEFAAVITDLVMPVMDGSAFIAALHRLDPMVPIIAFSGVARNADRAHAAGAQRFVVKASSPEALLGSLAAVLGRGAGSGAG